MKISATFFFIAFILSFPLVYTSILAEARTHLRESQHHFFSVLFRFDGTSPDLSRPLDLLSNEVDQLITVRGGCTYTFF